MICLVLQINLSILSPFSLYFLKQGRAAWPGFLISQMCGFISLLREKEKVVKQKGGKRQRRKMGRHTVKEQEKYHCTGCVCVCSTSGVCMSYISVMVSGRLVGISLSPFPLQSTMLLLQVQDSGHCNTLQEEDDDDWWPTRRQRANIIHGWYVMPRVNPYGEGCSSWQNSVKKMKECNSRQATKCAGERTVPKCDSDLVYLQYYFWSCALAFRCSFI